MNVCSVLQRCSRRVENRRSLPQHRRFGLLPPLCPLYRPSSRVMASEEASAHQRQQTSGDRGRRRRRDGISFGVVMLMLVEEALLLIGGVIYPFPELRGVVFVSGGTQPHLVWRLAPVAAATTALSFVSTVVTACSRGDRGPHPVLPSIMTTAGRFMVGLLLGVPYFHLAAIILGAPISELFMKTLLWAVIMSALCAAPLASSMPPSQLHTIKLLPTDLSGSDWVARCRVVGTVGGAWLGATLIPLDWGQPWQEWPITVTVGAMGGHCLGAVVAIVWGLVGSRGPNKAKASTVPP